MTCLRYKILFLVLLLIGCDSNERPVAEDSSQVTTTDTKVAQDSIDRDSKADIKSADTISVITPAETDGKKTKPVSEIASISGLWNMYKSAKARVNEALEADDIDTVITYLKIAGECAEQLGRPEIAAWQFNNIGHYSILEFKKLTDYDNRMRELAVMNDRNRRATFLVDSRKLFKDNIELLLRAENYLEQAQIIDDELEPSRRTATIERNREFITWVKEFTEQNS